MTTQEQAPDCPQRDAAPLLAAMRKGDPTTCREFVAYFQGPLFNYLYWLSGDPDTAAQLFQQTMMSVYTNLPRVRKSGAPDVWVYRHATQRYLDQVQRRSQMRRATWDNILKGGLDRDPDRKWSQWDGAPPDTTAVPPEETPRLVEALKALTPRERAAILLAATADFTPAARAKCLHVSRRAAARLQLRALAALASQLNGAPADSGQTPRGARDRIRRQQLGLLSAARARKLDAALETNEASQRVRDEERAAWRAFRRLPNFLAPSSLTEDTEAHLRAGQEAQEERIATWGFRFMQVTVPIFILAIIAVILVPTISRSIQAARVAAARENLEAIGQALIEYSQSAPGQAFPPMAADVPGAWVPDLRLLFPHYIQDPALLVRPSLNDPALVKAMRDALSKSPPDFDTAHRLLARSYVYTGYVLLDESALAAFKSLVEGAPPPELTGDLETADRVLRRLKRDIEYFFVTDRSDPQAASRTRARIPIMFETTGARVFGSDPESANVLYLDGHVESLPFGSQFPVTVGVRALLEDR
ncbi:MAG: hypothetical protein KF886_19390 [Candidatus Hydrogenedentes bacterium]|nr:hypothetical protein [Candidatus Hydrogenedentota bacterium]